MRGSGAGILKNTYVSFGERIHCRIPRRPTGPDLNKWDPRWADGVFLGVRAISNEVFVGTPEGIVKCRAIRRKTPDQRWNIDMLNKIQGLPWEPNIRSLPEPSAEERPEMLQNKGAASRRSGPP